MKGRYLRGNKGCEIPSNLVFFDTESYSSQAPNRPKTRILTLRLWCATYLRIEGERITRRKEVYGETSESFWRFVMENSSASRCTWIFAHNMPHDLTQVSFWHKLDAGDFTLEPLKRKCVDGSGEVENSWIGKLCLENHPFFIQCRNGKHTFKFVDTCNYWPSTLFEIGVKHGTAKGTLPNEDASKDEWVEYCKTDVKIIENAVTDLLFNWKRENCGVFQMTAPMLALTNFKHTCDIRTPDGSNVDIVPLPNHVSHEMERASYFGGRVTCFQVGELPEKVYHLDCNSLYPYVMMQNSFPRRLVRFQETPSHDDLRRARKCYGIVATVAISSGDNTYPVRIDGNQYHCTGKFWTALSGPELFRALDSGDISRIANAQYYSIAPLFRHWCAKWCDRKVRIATEGTKKSGEYEFTKLILNSLSGKFAQSGRHWKDVNGVYPLQRWGGWVQLDNRSGLITRWRGIAGNSQLQVDGREPDHSFPLISAYITAYGREYMRQVIDTCGVENVYYMATDSIICNTLALRKMVSADLVHPTQVGKFKVLGCFDTAEIYACNHYRLGNITLASGLLGRMLLAKSTGSAPEKWEKITSLIATGPRDSVTVSRFDLPKLRHDFRGKIGIDNRWIPFRLSHDEDIRGKGLVRPDALYYSSDTAEVHKIRVSLS